MYLLLKACTLALMVAVLYTCFEHESLFEGMKSTDSLEWIQRFFLNLFGAIVNSVVVLLNIVCKCIFKCMIYGF